MKTEAFYNLNGRLALFQKSAADKEHWEQRWSEASLGSLLESYSTGKLDEFDGIFTRYLPKDMPVLEAGCGNGQLVMALFARGYRIEGLDYAEATIERVREAAPQLNVRKGDIYKLDVPDGTYGGYISIGLFEHNAAGPQEALQETRRALHPNGIALISVPYLNRKRSRLLRQANVITSTEAPEGLNFYQYYYSVEEFKKYIEAAGLKVVEEYPYGVFTGIVRGSPFWEWFRRSRLFIWPVQRRFIRWCANAPLWMRFRSAHMLMFACKRNEAV